MFRGDKILFPVLCLRVSSFPLTQKLCMDSIVLCDKSIPQNTQIPSQSTDNGSSKYLKIFQLNEHVHGFILSENVRHVVIKMG